MDFILYEVTHFVCNFERVFPAYAMFHALDVETKVIRNFIGNIFGDYTFDVIFQWRVWGEGGGVNVKFESTSQSKWPPFSKLHQF